MQTTTSANETILRLRQKLQLSNDSQLAKFFGIHPSTILVWRDKDQVPDKYEEMVDDFIRDLRIGIKAILQIRVTPTEVSKELGIKTRSVTAMRSNNPLRYARIVNAIKVQKAIKLSGENQ